MSTSTHHLDLSSSVIAVSLIGGGAMGLGLGMAYRYDWLFGGIGAMAGLLIGLLISLATVSCCDWLRRRVETFAAVLTAGRLGRTLVLSAALAVELMKMAAPVITMSLLVALIGIAKNGTSPF